MSTSSPPPILEEPESSDDEEMLPSPGPSPDYEKLARDERSDSGDFLRPPDVPTFSPCPPDVHTDSESSWRPDSDVGRCCVEFSSPDCKLASVSFEMAEESTAPRRQCCDLRDEVLAGTRCAAALRLSICLLTVACCLAGLVLTVLGGLEGNRQCTASGCILLLSGAGLAVHFCIGGSSARPRPDFLRIISETAAQRSARNLPEADDGQGSGPLAGSQTSQGSVAPKVEVIRVVTMAPPMMRKRSQSIWQSARRMSMLPDPALSHGHHHVRSFHAPHLHRQRLRSFGSFDRYEHRDDRYL